MKLPGRTLLFLMTTPLINLSLHGEQAVTPATPAAKAPASASATPAAAPKTIMGSRVFKWEDLKFTDKAQGKQAQIISLPTPTFQIFESHVTTLNPGALSHQPHRHNQEELILIKEGTLDVNINSNPPQRVGPGSMFLFASNDLHNVKNVGTTPATYFVFNFTTGDTAARNGQPPASEAKVPGKLVTTIWDWDKLTFVPSKIGGRREVANSPTLTLRSFEVHVTTLNPGEAPHAPHHHGDEEMMIIKEGVLEATINGVSQRAGPGSILFYASNDEHGVKNVGTTPATYHVIRIVTDATPKEPETAAKKL